MSFSRKLVWGLMPVFAAACFASPALGCGGGGGRMGQTGFAGQSGMMPQMAMMQQMGIAQQQATMRQLQQARQRRQAFLAKQNERLKLRDTDGNGKVSEQEKLAFEQRTKEAKQAQKDQIAQLRSSKLRK
jgi:hypothetical protein